MGDIPNFGKRPRDDSESIGSSDSPKRIRTGIARWRHTLFRPLTDTQTSSFDHLTPHKQAEQAELDLELRLGPSQVDSHEASQASSSHQPFRWQEGQSALHQWKPEASHVAQSHQETRPSSQQEVIDEQMPIEIPLVSDSELNHARSLSIRETDHERIHHLAYDNQKRPDRAYEELKVIAQAYRDTGSHQGLPQELKDNIKSQPFTKLEFQNIHTLLASQLPKERYRIIRQLVYQQSEKGKEVKRKHLEKKKQKNTSTSNPKPASKDLE